MIAMQYSFRLPDSGDMDAIRRRVAEKAPLFDALPGLIQKAFLINGRATGRPGSPGHNEYATFYLWPSATDAQAFLGGDLFRAVVDAFGRPSVRTWLVLACGGNRSVHPAAALRSIAPLPTDALPQQWIARAKSGHADALRDPRLHSHVVALDPERWQVLRFGLWQALPPGGTSAGEEVHTYEVLHVAAPAGGPLGALAPDAA